MSKFHTFWSIFDIFFFCFCNRIFIILVLKRANGRTKISWVYYKAILGCNSELRGYIGLPLKTIYISKIKKILEKNLPLSCQLWDKWNNVRVYRIKGGIPSSLFWLCFLVTKTEKKMINYNSFIWLIRQVFKVVFDQSASNSWSLDL